MYIVTAGTIGWRENGVMHTVRQGEACDPPENIVARYRHRMRKIESADDAALSNDMDVQTTQMTQSQVRKKRRPRRKPATTENDES